MNTKYKEYFRQKTDKRKEVCTGVKILKSKFISKLCVVCGGRGRGQRDLAQRATHHSLTKVKLDSWTTVLSCKRSYKNN